MKKICKAIAIVAAALLTASLAHGAAKKQRKLAPSENQQKGNSDLVQQIIKELNTRPLAIGWYKDKDKDNLINWWEIFKKTTYTSNVIEEIKAGKQDQTNLKRHLTVIQYFKTNIAECYDKQMDFLQILRICLGKDNAESKKT